MSTLRVNNLTNQTGDGPPEFSQGVSIASGKTITGSISITGVATASSFVGSGVGITFSGNVIRNSKVIALSLVL
jgi:hypothetical protein